MLKNDVRNRNERKPIMSNKPLSLKEGNSDFTISRMLSEKNVTTLRKIAKSCKIKGYSKMKKDELESCLGGVICEKERLPESLYLLDKKKWMLFTELASAQCLELEDKLYEAATHLENLGLAFRFAEGKARYAAVPSEIREAFGEICDEDFMKKRENLSLYDDYANAAMALYGLVRFDELTELFESLSGRTGESQALADAVRCFAENGADYCIYQEYVASRAFEEHDFEDVQKFADIIYAVPRYTPDEKEFLRYSGYDYYEVTPQIDALRKYLVEDMKIEAFVANFIVDEIHHLSAVQGKPQEFVDVFNKYRIIKKEEQIYELMNLVHEVSMNTRLLGNHGHTQAEIMELRGETPDNRTEWKKVPASSEKIGRNEPCICGSGRKYKKCCGA